MDDAVPVRGGERVADLDADAQRLVDRHRSPRQPRGQGLALQELHHEKRGAPVVAHVVERADVRMVDARERPRLALESVAGLPVSHQFIRQDLDGYRPIEPRVTRFVDFAHTARAERGDNLVVAEAGAGSQGHGLATSARRSGAS